MEPITLFPDCGYLDLILGPMSSLKSTFLILKITTYADVGDSCIYINHSSDQRNVASQDDAVTTHHSGFSKLSPIIHRCKTNLLSDVDIDNFQFIAIDEAHLYPDLQETIIDWVNNKNKYVFVAGLDGDFKQETFESNPLSLIPHADTVTKRRAYCKSCSERGQRVLAPFTRRNCDLGPSKIVIGGLDVYSASCRKCRNKT